jgi:hypothetical protein
MTKTIQFHSIAHIEKKGLDNLFSSSALANPRNSKAQDNLKLLVSVYDSLNNLCSSLERLDYALKRKVIEINLFQENEEEKK